MSSKSNNGDTIIIHVDEASFKDTVIEILGNIKGRYFEGPPVFDPTCDICRQGKFVPAIRVQDINDSQKYFNVILMSEGEICTKEIHIDHTVQYQKFLVSQLVHMRLQELKNSEKCACEEVSESTCKSRLRIFKRNRVNKD